MDLSDVWTKEESEQYMRAIKSASVEDILRLRREMYTRLAEKAKRDADGGLLILNIMAAAEEASNKSLYATSDLFNHLVGFYILNTEGSWLEMVARGVIPELRKIIKILDAERKRHQLMQELGL